MLLVPRRPFILAKAPEPTRLPLAKADKYGQELSGVAGRAVWRLDKWPERFPRLRYRGFLSTGNVKGVMEGLGWRQEKIGREEDSSQCGELLRTVGVWGQFKDRVAGKESGGRIFETQLKGQEVRVSWAGLKLGPVGFNGQNR